MGWFCLVEECLLPRLVFSTEWAPGPIQSICRNVRGMLCVVPSKHIFFESLIFLGILKFNLVIFVYCHHAFLRTWDKFKDLFYLINPIKLEAFVNKYIYKL